MAASLPATNTTAHIDAIDVRCSFVARAHVTRFCVRAHAERCEPRSCTCYSDRMSAQTITLPDGTTRTLVRYEDFDGISLLADRNALLARYRDHDLSKVSDEDMFKASVTSHPTKTLLELANAREATSWGTHQSPGECIAVFSFTPFRKHELEENSIRSSLYVGHLAITGELFVGAWHSFTYGADYRHGEIECPRITVPEGLYRVTVHRPFSADEEAEGDDGITFLIHLERVQDGDVAAPLEEIPGADGWF